MAIDIVNLWAMTLAGKLEIVDRLRKELDQIRPLTQEAGDKLWQKFRLEWNYNSNHMEGNTLTYGETMLLLIHDRTTGDHEKREYDEMQAHDVAIKLVNDWSLDSERDLTESDIKNLNKIILVKPYWKEAFTYDGQPTRRLIKVGDYKEHPNSVRLKSGEMFHYASPQETPQLMQGLIDWYRDTDITHPVQLAAELHYRFIRIHPFDDGNGRIARLLANYVLMKHGYPPIIIKSRDKENYIAALQKADAGHMSSFVGYIAEQEIWSLDLEMKAAKGESIDDPDDIDKEIAVLKKQAGHEYPLHEERTPLNTCVAIEQNVIPIFKALDKRANELRELFFDFDRGTTYKTTGSGEYHVGSKNSDWNLLTENWLEKIKREKQQISELTYRYELKGLRKRTSVVNMVLAINVQFDDYNYRIKTADSTQPKTFFYGEKIPESDLFDLIKPMLNDIIVRIKNGQDPTHR